MSTFGSNLRSIRKSQGLSQAELASRSGVDQANISRMERGEGGFSMATIKSLAVALDVPQDMLFAEGSNVTRVSQGMRAVPVIDYVQVGNFTDSKASIPVDGDQEKVFTDSKLSDKAFAVRIEGDSMGPAFQQGDIVIIDPAVQPLPGDYVVASSGEDGALFKQYREREAVAGGGVIFDLHPLNDMYPVLRGDKLDLRIIGTMIEYRKFRKCR